MPQPHPAVPPIRSGNPRDRAHRRTQRRDIGRQGHRPDLVQCRVKGIALGIKGQTQPAIGDLDHRCRKLITKADDLTFAQFAKGFGKRVPSTGGRFQQCDLDPGNRIALWRHAGPGACQPCRNDLGVIEHQQIARLQDLGQITDMAVTNLLPLGQQQSRRTARSGRTRGDQGFGQMKIKIGQFHARACDCMSSQRQAR